MLECWNFNADLRPSFEIINQSLALIRKKYEIQSVEELNNDNKLFDGKLMNGFRHIGMNLDTLMSSTTKKNTIASPSSSSVLTTPFKSSTYLYNDMKFKTSHMDLDDSQYFSGLDTSLFYTDSSNVSSTSDYSVTSSSQAAACKAASAMAKSLAHRSPPSPPPFKPLSNLINVAASAAYQF